MQVSHLIETLLKGLFIQSLNTKTNNYQNICSWESQIKNSNHTAVTNNPLGNNLVDVKMHNANLVEILKQVRNY